MFAGERIDWFFVLCRMVRDLAAVRRTPARASTSSSASEVGNDENAPVDASDAAVVEPEAAAARPPLLAIQPPQSGLKRKPESPAPTPTKLPFRTPEKAAARSRFGWVPPRGEEQPPPRVGGTPYSAVSTPGRHRGKSSAAAASEGGGGSTQSTPTKSVTKPAYSIGMSASRPPMSGGPRGAGLGLGFSMAARGTPMSFAPVTVVNTAEVPHFELREDPSFWMENNVQVRILIYCLLCSSLLKSLQVIVREWFALSLISTINVSIEVKIRFFFPKFSLISNDYDKELPYVIDYVCRLIMCCWNLSFTSFISIL